MKLLATSICTQQLQVLVATQFTQKPVLKRSKFDFLLTANLLCWSISCCSEI